MTTLLTTVYYIIPPVVASWSALWGAKYFGDWRVGLITGSLAGMVTTLVVAGLYWDGSDVCATCNQGAS